MEGTKLKILARTYELDDAFVQKLYDGDADLARNDMLADSTVFSGKAAGVCYMPDDYMEEGIQNVGKAIDRAKTVDENTHHSTFDHAHVTFEIKSNKMIAMILNSLGCYATSEKSARFTKMKPDTDLELQLYNKWIKKVQGMVLQKYPWYDDKELTKRLNNRVGTGNLVVKDGVLENEVQEYAELLESMKLSETLPSYKVGQENARYMISVFTPTTFLYTISVRRVFEIAHMLRKLYINLILPGADEFSRKLAPHVLSAWKSFEEVTNNCNEYNIKLRDSKNQYIRFLTAQHRADVVAYPNGEEDVERYADMDLRLKEQVASVFGDNYDIVEYNSLACLAQKHRHRTIDYTMTLRKIGEYGWYIPNIVFQCGAAVEWLSDIQSVAYCVPQGTLVRVRERGLFEYFVLKAKERMCGRAQLETMMSTKYAIEGFINNRHNLSYENQILLDSITAEDERTVGKVACARCRFKDYFCTEGCQWGADNALNRLI